jgi:hypothetical protein
MITRLVPQSPLGIDDQEECLLDAVLCYRLSYVRIAHADFASRMGCSKTDLPDIATKLPYEPTVHSRSLQRWPAHHYQWYMHWN